MVVQHIKDLRYVAGNDEIYIQVEIRGHKIGMSKWSRWLKEDSTGELAVPQSPPGEFCTYCLPFLMY